MRNVWIFVLMGVLVIGSIPVLNSDAGSSDQVHEPKSVQENGGGADTGAERLGSSPMGKASGQTARPPARYLSVADASNPLEIDWATRNLAYSHEFLERIRAIRIPLESINPADGFTMEELASAYEWAVDAQATMEKRRRASDLLVEAATQGSIAALGSLASIYASGTRRNPIEAEAYFRLQEMRGDWLASLRHGATDLLYQLDPTESTLAGLRAHEILGQINAARFSRGQPNLGVDPRPGLDAALGAMRRNFEEEQRAPRQPPGGD